VLNAFLLAIRFALLMRAENASASAPFRTAVPGLRSCAISKDRMDYTIIAAVVNLAARIQAAADPGGILISYPTWALVPTSCAPRNAAAAAKDMRREVRVFAVAGLLDDHDAAPVARA
jgi:class 3 adenylate cyclase